MDVDLQLAVNSELESTDCGDKQLSHETAPYADQIPSHHAAHDRHVRDAAMTWSL